MTLPPLLAQYIARRPHRIELLRHIAEQGSITRAAKAAGLSYKGAWDAIDELNNLAHTPLVERVVGGKGGGGARLSEEGQRMLRLYEKLQALQAQVLEAAEEASDLDLLGRLMLRTSARNQLQGRVTAIDAWGRNDQITLDLGAGLSLRAQITHDSTHTLTLAPGAVVVALVKAGWLCVLPLDAAGMPGHNCLQGVMEQILPDTQGPCEMRIGLANGQTLCALSEQCSIREGDSVNVWLDPANVLLGTPL
ncbi:LysR family transcriptional regulator [Pseudomonas sp. CFBP 8770]|uniref:TOBE domain-containing protein n=1 Tax=unclassified Pseudomonas TaxID=196821 RepID=UPI00177FFFE3|nr:MULTISPECIES: TOBE domain-containing protein [unclassified Pseudomonas]MBD8473962.1 LysR family transcriptional regulator [Pseudomonas sp. CFBP 8773]MBD8647091.1 LysR family transcriptional regulator [Pseudomonas sp. CFBP 8770]